MSPSEEGNIRVRTTSKRLKLILSLGLIFSNDDCFLFLDVHIILSN